MAKKSKIAVVFPVFNGAATLRRSLQCVALQTVTDFRAIIIDNCSTDGSLSIAKEFCAEDSRFSVVINDKHLSGPENLAKGVAIGAQLGEYFCLRACDDYSSSDFLEKLSDALDRHPEKLLAACDTKACGPEITRLKRPTPSVVHFYENYVNGNIPRNLTFPAEWIYNLYRSEAQFILEKRWFELGNPWAFASYVVAAFVMRDLVVYVKGPTYDFTEGSGSERKYGAKRFRDKLLQRLRYTLGCFNIHRELPPSSLLTKAKLFRMCWNDARRKTRYKLFWIF